MDDGYLSEHFDSIGTTTVRAVPGIFHALVVNQRGSANARVVVRDDLRVIANVQVGGGTVMVGSLIYDAYFYVNLTVQRVGGSAPDITVLFK